MVYSPFSDGVELPHHDITSPGLLMMSNGAEFFMSGCPSCRQPHAWEAISNSSTYCIMAGTQLIHLCAQFLQKQQH